MGDLDDLAAAVAGTGARQQSSGAKQSVDAWSLRFQDRDTGPFTRQQLVDMLFQGIVTGAATVRQRGRSTWLPIHSLLETGFSEESAESPNDLPVLSAIPLRGGARQVLFWPAELGAQFDLLWVGLISLGLVAFSMLMKIVTILAGGLAGIAYISGRVVFLAALAMLGLVAIAKIKSAYFKQAVLVATAFGAICSIWGLVLIYYLLAKPSLSGVDMLAASQVGPGSGMYLGLISSIACAVSFGLLYQRQCLLQLAQSGFNSLNWVAGSAVAVAVAGILIAKQIDVPSAAIETGGDSAFAGLSPDRSPAGVQTNFTLQEVSHQEENGAFRWAAWQVTNQDQQPLTVNRVVINGEHTLSGAFAYSYGFFRDPKFTPPVTLSIGQSQLFFECNPNDSESYLKNIVFVDIYTDRGNFRWKDGAFNDLPSDAESNLPAAEAQYDQQAAKAWDDAQAANRAQNTAFINALTKPGPPVVNPGAAPGADPVTGVAPSNPLDTSQLPRQ